MDLSAITVKVQRMVTTPVGAGRSEKAITQNQLYGAFDEVDLVALLIGDSEG